MRKAILVAVMFANMAHALSDSQEQLLASAQTSMCTQYVERPEMTAKARASGIPAVSLHAIVTAAFDLKTAKTAAQRQMMQSTIDMQHRVIDRIYSGNRINEVREELLTTCYDITRTYAEAAWTK